MNLLPFGPMLPVHCCCEPGKRFGWVPVPRNRQRLGQIRFVCGYPKADLTDGTITPAPVIFTTIETLRRPLMPIVAYQCEKGRLHYTIDVWIEQLAVNSAELPIEQWRKVTGFVEDHGYGKKEAATEEEDTDRRARRRDAVEEEESDGHHRQALRLE